LSPIGLVSYKYAGVLCVLGGYFLSALIKYRIRNNNDGKESSGDYFGSVFFMIFGTAIITVLVAGFINGIIDRRFK
jgi:hypothetical protein